MVAGLNPTPEIRGAFYDIQPRARFWWVPLGLRGVLPVRRGRIESWLGAGGLFEQYQVSNPHPEVGLVSHRGFGGYVAGGAAIAVDKGRHVWVGASPHLFLANGSYVRDR